MRLIYNEKLTSNFQGILIRLANGFDLVGIARIASAYCCHVAHNAHHLPIKFGFLKPVCTEWMSWYSRIMMPLSQSTHSLWSFPGGMLAMSMI
jgi:hypothetical protein